MTRLLLLLLCWPLLTQAQIYKSTDAEGNVVFTDKPPDGSTKNEQVELKPLNTTPAPDPSVQPRRAPESGSDKPASAPQLAITSPQNETVIPIGAAGNFSVQASTSPPLAEGEMLELLLDGSAVVPPQNSSSWELSNILRGGHDLTVRRLDSNGEPVATSEPVRVYVMRPFNTQNRN
ncbi:DUF4124 domain-containing protein [Kineobactrum salinum]|uniref:DUF4124 domain-containing protein n=1 Tax=Kineobactrum salinum TaxID=2708301 RepID=A0A6C0U5V6_9GAMM|nr:DUF4124 domain-containing protein [Kineobactrum salinum]QIB65805.1 DUF4124 domain-containing protein [Kineobactrum salinum]